MKLFNALNFAISFSLYLCKRKMLAIKLELKFNLPKNLKDKLNLIFSARPSQFVNTKYKWGGGGRRQGSGPICSINYTRMAFVFNSIHSHSNSQCTHRVPPTYLRMACLMKCASFSKVSTLLQLIRIRCLGQARKTERGGAGEEEDGRWRGIPVTEQQKWPLWSGQLDCLVGLYMKYWKLKSGPGGPIAHTHTYTHTGNL